MNKIFIQNIPKEHQILKLVISQELIYTIANMRLIF